MAPLSLYDLTIPMFIHGLQALDAVLTKAEEHAQANDIPLSTYIDGQLAPDMAELPFQIQAAGDFAMFVVTEVGDIAVPKPPHTETTFAELHQRIALRLETFRQVKPEGLDGKQDKVIRHRGKEWSGLTWCTTYCIPNFYFHVVTAYGILRHMGVPIGKADFLGLPSDFYSPPGAE